MSGFTGEGRQLGIAQSVQFGKAPFGQNVEELLIPFRVERVQRAWVFDEALSREDDPLLARFTLIGRQVSAAAHQSVGQAGIHFGEFRHRWLMRQTAGCKEQDPFIQCAGKSPDGLA
ncbi:hypothetical protein D3C71_1781130 [compost metagenome]